MKCTQLSERLEVFEPKKPISCFLAVKRILCFMMPNQNGEREIVMGERTNLATSVRLWSILQSFGNRTATEHFCIACQTSGCPSVTRL